MSIGLRMAGTAQPRPIDPALVGWWKLDGNLTDSSGKGNDGTGTPEYEDGKFGQSYRGRDTNFITTPIVGNVAPGTSILTMGTWVRNRGSFNTDRRFLGVPLANRRGTFLISLGGDVSFNIGTSGGGETFAVGNIGTDVWTHLVMTRTGQAIGSAYTFFLNGVPVLSENAAVAAGGTAAAFGFGGMGTGTDVGLSGVFLYTRALAPAEIRYVYESGRPVLL